MTDNIPKPHSEFEMDLAGLIGAAKAAQRYFDEWQRDHKDRCKYECKCRVSKDIYESTTKDWYAKHDAFLAKHDPARQPAPPKPKRGRPFKHPRHSNKEG